MEGPSEEKRAVVFCFSVVACGFRLTFGVFLCYRLGGCLVLDLVTSLSASVFVLSE